jgi:FdhE protein
MKAPAAILEELGRRQSEWRPWLAVLEVAVRECEDGRWDPAVPPEWPACRVNVPLLDGASISVDRVAARRFLQSLIAAASSGGTPKMKTLHASLKGDVDLAALIASSIRQDAAPVANVARTGGADPEALQAVVALMAIPLLHACRRKWKRAAPQPWGNGYCPVCGAWPAYAEVRGIERSRYLRCGRCGSDWQASQLCCVYCRNSDHERLRSLVPENAGAQAIDVCKDCNGYVKTFTTLQGSAPVAVMLEDLASVDLDVAAVQQGYHRQTPDAFGLTVKRDLLRRAMEDDPGPEDFEAWLLNYPSTCGAAELAGPALAMARAVFEEWRLAHTVGEFRAWLEQGAPSDDAGAGGGGRRG